ncbi:MAG: gliding motility lipoprotein GldH [Chlorobi bacterium]|nr:gliding motility lipoprotein GldH [Chlorobiota bacterium]
MKNKQFIYLILFFALALFSCESKTIISDSKKIENEVWNIGVPVNLELEVNDISKFYNLFINVNVKEDFLTNNLWLFISTKSPSGNVQTDTVMYYVTDEKGKWFGDKSGDIVKNKFVYKPNIKFPEQGKYLFSISHGMREMDLPKVSLVGVTAEEVVEDK